MWLELSMDFAYNPFIAGIITKHSHSILNISQYNSESTFANMAGPKEMTSSKNIIITGAGGMIGPMLAKRLLDDGHKLVLTDLVQPKVPEGVAHPENAKCMKGDICDPAFVKSLIEAAQPLDAIFIFHGIMSAGSEANFDLVSSPSLEPARHSEANE
jgi:hypothetical protein